MKNRIYGLLIFLVLIAFKFELDSQPLPLTRWKYIQVDSTRQKWGDFQSPDWLRYFGLDFGDVNRDGFADIVSGRYIYLNPGGDMTSPWKRFDLGMNADGYLFTDVDGDANADIIAEAFPDVFWFEAMNRNGSLWKAYNIGRLPATDHVNAQGGCLAQILPGLRPQIVLSTGGGIYAVTVPDEPEVSANWKYKQIVANQFDEGLAFADFDGDGDLDLTSGDREAGEPEGLVVNWWENPGNINVLWHSHAVGHTIHWADRFKAADLNGDKWPDIVVSEERYPGPDPDANLYWFENPGTNNNGIWLSHIIITAYSLNNLDAADLDKDGDIDLVTNEHKGKVHKLFLLENNGKGNFSIHIADTGKECHLGALFVDLDCDGDLDIAGHAWDNYKYLHIWRNDAIQKYQSRIPFEMTELSRYIVGSTGHVNQTGLILIRR